MPFEFRIPRTVPRFHLLFTLFSSIYKRVQGNPKFMIRIHAMPAFHGFFDPAKRKSRIEALGKFSTVRIFLRKEFFSME